MIEIGVATVAQAKVIVSRMRDQEKKEYGIVNEKPEISIIKTLGTSVASWTATVNGEPACMWGISQTSFMGGAHIWMVTTPLVEEYWIRFLQQSRRVIQESLNEYGFLYGYVDTQFTISMKWMEWLGFEVAARTQLGSLELLRYEMRARDGN